MSPRPHILTGLYAITDNNLIPKQRFIETVELAIIGGAKIIQYRDKSDDKKHRFEQAHALKQLCHHYQIPLLINDDIALAQQVGAEGVHLGKEDVSLSTARAVLGEKAIIGVSCYNQLPLALKAIEAGATYVAYGRFFPSQSKPNAIQANIALLHQTRQQLHCPLVAIGGITPDNGSELIKAGVNCLAVIQGLFGQPDVKVVAQRYAQLFAYSHPK